MVILGNETAETAFAAWHSAIADVATLLFVRWELTDGIKIDESDYGIGGYLYQCDNNQPKGKEERIIAQFQQMPTWCWTGLAST